jgi:hypothetical protein
MPHRMTHIKLKVLWLSRPHPRALAIPHLMTTGFPNALGNSVTRQNWQSHRQPKLANAKARTIQKKHVGKREL